MSKKRDLAKEIRLLEGEISGLESKRSRSQAAIIESLISHAEPDAMDVEYFRAFTAEIEVKREHLQAITKELEALV